LFGRCVHEIFLSRFSEIIFQIAVKVSFTKNSVGVVSCVEYFLLFMNYYDDKDSQVKIRHF